MDILVSNHHPYLAMNRTLHILFVLLIMPATIIAQVDWRAVGTPNLTASSPITSLIPYGDVIIAGGAFPNHLVSADDALSWSQGYSAFSSTSVLDIAREGDMVVIANNARKPLISTDGGSTFEPSAANLGSTSVVAGKALIHQGKIYIIQVQTSAAYASTDSGATWSTVVPINGGLIRSLVLHNDTLFTTVANAQGGSVLYSTDNGGSWTLAQTGISTLIGRAGELFTAHGDLYLQSVALNNNRIYKWTGSGWEEFIHLVTIGASNFSATGGQLIIRKTTNELIRYNPDTDEWDVVVESVTLPAGYAIRGILQVGDRFIFSIQRFINLPSVTVAYLAWMDEGDHSLSYSYAPLPLPIASPLVTIFSSTVMGDRVLMSSSDRWRVYSQDAGDSWFVTDAVAGSHSARDLAQTSAGIVAIQRDAQLSSSSSIVRYDSLFGNPVQLHLENGFTSIQTDGDTLYVTRSNNLQRSVDHGVTLMTIPGQPTGRVLTKPILSGDSIFVGNILSKDRGATWARISTRSPVATTKIGQNLFLATSQGLFRISGDVNPQNIDAASAEVTNQNVTHLTSDGTNLFFIVGRNLYTSSNLGQTIDDLGTMPTAQGIIRSLQMVGELLYLTLSDGVFTLDVSLLGVRPIVASLDAVNIAAVDSSRYGVSATFKADIQTFGIETELFAESDVRFGDSELVRSASILTSAERDTVDIPMTGIQSDAFLRFRVVAVALGDTMYGEWIDYRTPLYAFWQRAILGEPESYTFYDGIRTATGRILAASAAGIFKSDDETFSWALVEDSPQFINRLAVMNGDTIIGGSTIGQFFRSTDNAETWTPISSTGLPGSTGGNRKIHRMAYSGAHHTLLAIFGEREQSTNNVSMAVLSRDGGRTWTEIQDTLLLRNRLHVAVMAAPNGDLFISSDIFTEGEPTILRSQNGGRHWDVVLTGTQTSADLGDIRYAGNRIVATLGNRVLVSEDGGDTFTDTRGGASRLILPIADNEYITARGYWLRDGTFFGETMDILRPDGRTRSVMEGFGTGRYVNQFKDLGENVILAFSNTGLWRWKQGGGGFAVGIEDHRFLPPVEIAQSFELDANYPNPFNPSTVISYRKSEIGRVRLAVYDLLGREVAVLVDGMIPAGEHQVRFDASGLSSGVYLYRLETPQGVQTRKMTLVR